MKLFCVKWNRLFSLGNLIVYFVIMFGYIFLLYKKESTKGKHDELKMCIKNDKSYTYVVKLEVNKLHAPCFYCDLNLFIF